MNAERLRQALASRKVVYGTWVQTPSPEVVEMLGWSGWDFVILDLEHGSYGAEGLRHLIRAAETSKSKALRAKARPGVPAEIGGTRRHARSPASHPPSR